MNTEANASEFQGSLEEMFARYLLLVGNEHMILLPQYFPVSEGLHISPA